MKFWSNLVIGLFGVGNGCALFAHAFFAGGGWNTSIALGAGLGWFLAARFCLQDAHRAHVAEMERRS